MQSTRITAVMPLLKILKVCGLWPWTMDEKKDKFADRDKVKDKVEDKVEVEDKNVMPRKLISMLEKLYRYILQVSLSFVCIALMWIEVIKSEDLTQAGDVLYISFTETAFLVKVFNIWVLSRSAVDYVTEIGSNRCYDLRSPQEHEFWAEKQKLFNRISIVYIGGSVAVGVFAFAGVLLIHDFVLPFVLWVPFEWHNSRNYWIVYIYELFAIHLTCVSNTTLDMIQCYFLFHIALLYKLIGMRLRELECMSEERVVHELRQIFQLHSSVRRLIKQCETLVSVPILAQITLSAFVLCFTGYRLRNLNFIQDTGRFFATLQFLSVMALQIFLPCYFANEITVNANELTLCVYNCNWHRYSIPTRKIIFIYMETLKKPVKIKAGGFFEIGLPIFSKTMNNAYSFFAILLNMEKE